MFSEPIGFNKRQMLAFCRNLNYSNTVETEERQSNRYNLTSQKRTDNTIALNEKRAFSKKAIED